MIGADRPVSQIGRLQFACPAPIALGNGDVAEWLKAALC